MRGPGCSKVGHLQVFINHMRKKIEPDAANPKYILTEPAKNEKLSSTQAKLALDEVKLEQLRERHRM
jgi:hypothetical protein